MEKQSNQRQYPRLFLNWSLTYRGVFDEDVGEQYQTQILDISEGGIGFGSKSQLPVGTPCLFWLQIPVVEQTVRLVGETVWQVELDRTINTGVQWVYCQDNRVMGWIRKAAQLDAEDRESN